MKYSRECSGCSHDTCSVITGMLRRSLYSMPDAARSTFTLFCFSFDFSAMLCLTLSTRLLLNITVINQSLRAIRKRDVQLLWFRNYPFPGHLRWRGNDKLFANGFAPIFPDTCYHLTHYWLAAVDIPVASDNPVHYADAIRYNARTPLQGSLLPLTRLVWA